MGVISARSLSILSLGCLAGPWEVRTSLNFSRVVLEFGHRMALGPQSSSRHEVLLSGMPTGVAFTGSLGRTLDRQDCFGLQ